MSGWTIGQLASAAGVGVEAVRFYQRRGLLHEPPRPAGGVRRYGRRDLDRLRFIKSAQRIGFALRDVEELLGLEDGAHCTEARVVAERKLQEVRQRLRDLRAIEQALDALVAECRDAGATVSCPLIDSLRRAPR